MLSLRMGDRDLGCREAEGAHERLSACARELRMLSGERRERIWSEAPRVLAKAASLFCQGPSSPFVQRALKAGEHIGMLPQMVREALSRFFPRIDADALSRLRESQLRLPEGQEIVPPSLTFHVLAGNLFLSGIESMLWGSLCGGCNLVRCSAADRHFPVLWLEALLEADAEFARTVAVGYWPRGQEELTAAACAAADAVVAFGADESVGQVRSLTPPGRRFVAHAAKLSLALVGKEALGSAGQARRYAQELAYDFTVYDQQGCLSPRAAFVESGGRIAPREFADYLCEAMREAALRLPRRALTLEEAASLARARDETLIEAAAGDAQARLVSRAEDPFLATLRSASPYAPGSMNRHCDLRVFGSPGELDDALAPYRGRVSTVAAAGESGRWRELCRRLRVPRVCRPGRMQIPPLGWTHDGRLPLMDLVEIAETEF